MITGAFRSSRPVARNVEMAMSKYWKKHSKRAEGEVRKLLWRLDPRYLFLGEHGSQNSFLLLQFWLILLVIQIRQHLSMHEQAPVMPWLATFPQKVIQRLHRYKWPVGMGVSYYLLFNYADADKAAKELAHRF